MNTEASSSYAIPEIPSEIAGPLPRKVGLNFDGDARFLLIVILCFFVPGLIFLGWKGYDYIIQFQHRTALHSGASKVIGEVTRFSWGRYSPMSVNYKFAVNGVTYSGEALEPSSPGLGTSLNKEDDILVCFLPSDPAVNHPDAWKWSPVIGWYFVLGEVFFTSLGGWASAVLLRNRKLARIGKAAAGRVTSCIRIQEARSVYVMKISCNYAEPRQQDVLANEANGSTLTTSGQNQLVAMNGGAVSIVYDAFGNRVAKTANGVTTRYLVDDLNPTGLPQVMDEVTNGVVMRTYTYGLQRIAENQIVSGAWVPSFYSYDGLGNVRQLTNTAGAITNTYEYNAFGNEVASTGTTPNNYLYRGEQYDPDLGLYYLRARYYNPQTGRFMSRDPKAGKLQVPATLHKYLYAGGDPAMRSTRAERTRLSTTRWILENQKSR